MPGKSNNSIHIPDLQSCWCQGRGGAKGEFLEHLKRRFLEHEEYRYYSMYGTYVALGILEHAARRILEHVAKGIGTYLLERMAP